ncbi:MAG: LCP family protein [Phascolarctobacterium sp.]|nr:LCP family protein [Candidatus Phascolarctobacterium caballi]
MDFEKNDSEVIQRDIEQKRLEIEKEIEEKRRAVEEEIAFQRREMEKRLVAQREELDRRHAEQVEAMNRQVNARELAQRIEAEFNNGKEQLASGIIEEQPAIYGDGSTADADKLMSETLSKGDMIEDAIAKGKAEAEAKKQVFEYVNNDNVADKTDEIQEQEKAHNTESGLLSVLKNVFGNKTDEEIAADIAAEDAAMVEQEQKELKSAEQIDTNNKKDNVTEQKSSTYVVGRVGSVLGENETDKVNTDDIGRKNGLSDSGENTLDQNTTKSSGENDAKDNGRRKVRRSKRIAWGRLIALIFSVVLIILIFFFGTAFVCRMLLHQGKVAVVYPVNNAAMIDGKKGEVKLADAVLEERINVLVLGVDYGDSEADRDEPKRTDAMILLSFDPIKDNLSVLSIPRDTKVILPGHRDPQKINAAYAFGGVMMAKQTVANLLGVPITHYVLADWKAFTEIVDLIGGVDIFVEHDMKYDDPYANLHIDLKKGYQHLDGKQSGQYVRYRSDELGDIGRVQRQQKFIKTVAEQMFTVSNIAKIPSLIKTVSDCMETDMNALTMLKAVNSVKVFGKERFKTGTLYGDVLDEGDVSYWSTDEVSIKRSLSELGIPTSKN